MKWNLVSANLVTLLSSCCLRGRIVKCSNHKESNDCSGRYSCTSFPPNERIRRHKSKVFQMAAMKTENRCNSLSLRETFTDQLTLNPIAVLVYACKIISKPPGTVCKEKKMFVYLEKIINCLRALTERRPLWPI